MKKIEWHLNNCGFTVKGNYFSPTSMLVHIERLPEAKVIAKKSWFLTDDFEGYIDYKGHRFLVETPFVEIEVIALNKETPTHIVREVLEHAEKYKWVNPFSFIFAMFRYLMLPFNPR
jgi:hypothetical protein